MHQHRYNNKLKVKEKIMINKYNKLNNNKCNKVSMLEKNAVLLLEY